MSVRQNIKVAIAGVGNCASALVQGVEYYRDRQGADLDGVMRTSIGGYRCGDIEFVAAFDVDRRKVGHPLEEAIFAKPNCTRIFQSALPVSNVIVQVGPVLDGVAAMLSPGGVGASGQALREGLPRCPGCHDQLRSGVHRLGSLVGAAISRRWSSHRRRRHQEPGRCNDRTSFFSSAVLRPRG